MATSCDMIKENIKDKLINSVYIFTKFVTYNLFYRHEYKYLYLKNL